MAKIKFPTFDDYACDGDSIKWQKDGFEITARIERDEDARITDKAGCYSKKKIEAWKNDDWFFAGVVLSVAKNGIEITDNAQSLWGIECNYSSRKGGNSYLSEVAQDLEGEALDYAKKRLTNMIDALTKNTPAEAVPA